MIIIIKKRKLYCFGGLFWYTLDTQTMGRNQRCQHTRLATLHRPPTAVMTDWPFILVFLDGWMIQFDRHHTLDLSHEIVVER